MPKKSIIHDPTGMGVGATAIGPMGGGNVSFNPMASPVVGGRGLWMPTDGSLSWRRGNVIGGMIPIGFLGTLPSPLRYHSDLTIQPWFQ